MKRVQKLAMLLESINNCRKAMPTTPDPTDHFTIWEKKHLATLDEETCSLPSGSGFDNGTKFDRDNSTPEKLIFTTAFHHMNEGGMYDGWTDHDVIITASLVHGFAMRVTGRDREQIKSYIEEVFNEYLEEEVTWP